MGRSGKLLQQTQKLIQENDIKSIDDLAKLSEDDQKFLMESQQQATQVALKPVIETYAAINEEFKKFDAPVYANLGNWDLTVAYQIMDAVTFVENHSSVNVNGVTLQATTNTGEVPKYYNDPALAQFLQPHFINYATGYDSPETKDANNADLKRLESGKPADIMMYHKTPNTSEDKIGSGTSAKEYLQDSSNVLRLGGHFHGSKIEHENGHPVLRPNPDEFFVIDYDESNKKVRHVDVYTIN